MSETPNNNAKSKVLSLKGKSSTVRQSFSHGRSKSVVVETKRKRLLVPQNLEQNKESTDQTNTSSNNVEFTKDTNEKNNISDIASKQFSNFSFFSVHLFNIFRIDMLQQLPTRQTNVHRPVLIDGFNNTSHEIKSKLMFMSP